MFLCFFFCSHLIWFHSIIMKKGVPSVLKQMHKKGSCAKAGSEYKANKRMDSLSTSTRIPSVCVVVVVVVGGGRKNGTTVSQGVQSANV